MKRVIALIISIAMVASLATGLAVTGLAIAIPVTVYFDSTADDYFCADESGYWYSPNSIFSDTNYFSVMTDTDGSYTLTVEQDVDVEKIEAHCDLIINIPSDKTLTVSSTDCDAIYVDGNLTITGGGKIDVYASGTDLYGIYAGNDITISGGTVSAKSIGNDVYGIYSMTGNIDIDGEKTKVDVFVSGSDVYGMWAAEIEITNGGYVSVKTLGNSLRDIFAMGDITITDSTVIVDGLSYGLCANSNIIILGENTYIKSNGTIDDFHAGNAIKVNGVTITKTDSEDGYYKNYFKGTDVSFIKDNNGQHITGNGFVIFGTAPNPEEITDDSAEESDPEVEIDFGFGPVTVKTSNKSIVLNDKKIVETEVLQSENLFVPFDLSNTPVKLDGLFLNNDVYQYISGVGKGIELETRFAKADVFKKDNIGQNPLSLHLSDVSEVAGTCATAIQKKAMNTNKVYAEVNYTFVTNGNPTDNNARIYVPVDGEAKVFYIINENTLGSIPCETRNGYCVFNRYMDGTYVICAK